MQNVSLCILSPQVMSFISFVCFAASTAAAFITAPLIEFLAALFLLFAYSTKFNERFKGFHWPLVVSFLTYKLHRASDNNICPWKPVLPNHHACCFIKDFLRCVSASIIFFIISIMSVSKYVDGASKAAGVGSHQFSQILFYRLYQWQRCLFASYTTCDLRDVCTGFMCLCFSFSFKDLWLHYHNILRAGLLFHLQWTGQLPQGRWFQWRTTKHTRYHYWVLIYTIYTYLHYHSKVSNIFF